MFETNKGVTRKGESFEQHWKFHHLKFTLTELLASRVSVCLPFLFGLANTELITLQSCNYFCLNKPLWNIYMVSYAWKLVIWTVWFCHYLITKITFFSLFALLLDGDRRDSVDFYCNECESHTYISQKVLSNQIITMVWLTMPLMSSSSEIRSVLIWICKTSLFIAGVLLTASMQMVPHAVSALVTFKPVQSVFTLNLAI